MIDEAIKQEIQRAINSELSETKKIISELKDSLEIFSLPLKSLYKVLTWIGTCDGTAFAPLFPIGSLINRIIVIKSFKIVPYCNGDYIDIAFSDGTTETVPDTARINRLFDNWDQSAQVNFLINGSPLPIFSDDNRVPMDLALDNIYYKYPEKLQTMDLNITGLVVDDLAAQTFNNPNAKVVVECYIL